MKIYKPPQRLRATANWCVQVVGCSEGEDGENHLGSDLASHSHGTGSIISYSFKKGITSSTYSICQCGVQFDVWDPHKLC